MRAPWTSSALLFLLVTLFANQYPLWGSNDPVSDSTTWGLAYLFAAGMAFIAGIVAFATPTFRPRFPDLGTAATVLAFAFYAEFLWMTLVKNGSEDTYLLAVGLASVLLGLGFLWLQRPQDAASS